MWSASAMSTIAAREPRALDEVSWFMVRIAIRQAVERPAELSGVLPPLASLFSLKARCRMAMSHTSSRDPGNEEVAMSVRKVQYCYVTVSNRPGQGSKVLKALRDAKVNLLAYSGFPTRKGESQLDFVADRLAPILRVGRKLGLKTSGAKKGFLIRGKDRLGAVQRQIQKLADRNINVTAADAITAGKGQF